MSEHTSVRNILTSRVVYWGPAGSGKTTSVNTLRRLLDPERRTHTYSLALQNGQTHSFDLLPIEEFRFGRFRVRMRVVAVPGSASQLEMRRALVRRADAIIFVADSRRAALQRNVESMHDLLDAMQAHDIEPTSVPVVWTCNYQDDADAASRTEVAQALGLPADSMMESVATEGHGILETFGEAFRWVTGKLVEQHKVPNVDTDGVMPTQVLPQLVRGAQPRQSDDAKNQLVINVPEKLAARAQDAEVQLRLVEAHIECESLRQQLDRRNQELMAINRVARSILSAMEADNLLVVLLDSTAEYLGAEFASCVLFDPTNAGQLRTHVLGFGRDPILGLPPAGAQRFFEFLQNSDGPVPADAKRNPDLLHDLKSVDRRVTGAMIQPIKGARGKPAGWISIYSCAEDIVLTTQQLLFLSSISRLAALGIEQIALFDNARNHSSSTEDALRTKTGELEMANAKIRALNRGLESRVTERTHALENSNRQLRETHAGSVYAARLSGMAQLGASFAHEVNNPVAGLTGNLHFMREALDELRSRVAVTSAEGADALQAIDEFEEVIGESLQSAGRVSSLIGSLKRFGAEDGGTKSISVNALIADAVMLMEERLHQCAELELRLGDVGDLVGDESHVSHVVLALLTNAVEAIERTGNPGKISVTTFQTGEKVTLVVRDDGVGVASELLPRVFEPFTTTKDGVASAGLGLHCAMRTVKSMGGTIRMRSKPGDGTTVTVVVPVAVALAVETELASGGNEA